MRNIIVYGVFFVLLSCSNEQASENNSINYPVTKTVPFVETLHGTEISDPYRWLEEFTSDESNAWVDKQNDFTQSFIKESKVKAAIRRTGRRSLARRAAARRPPR